MWKQCSKVTWLKVEMAIYTFFIASLIFNIMSTTSSYMIPTVFSSPMTTPSLGPSHLITMSYLVIKTLLKIDCLSFYDLQWGDTNFELPFSK